MSGKGDRTGMFTMVGPRMTRHVKRTAKRDRRRPAPGSVGGTAPPAQLRLEDQTRSGLARLGQQFYAEVLQVHDPLVAKAASSLEEAERNLKEASVKVAEAEAAASVPARGPANDASRTPRRTLKAARAGRAQAEARVAAASAALFEAEMARGAAIDAAREQGYQHLAFGEAVGELYREAWAQHRIKYVLGGWLTRLFRRTSRPAFPDITPAPSELSPAEWMADNHPFARRDRDAFRPPSFNTGTGGPGVS